VLDRFVIQAFPNILERIDEGDTVLRDYIVYAQPFYFVSGVFSILYYVKIYRRSVDMLRRFGRHPEDWEKSDPSLLTRDLSEAQQQAIQDLEWETMTKAAVNKERERKWLAMSAPVGIDDEIESMAEMRALDNYMRLIHRQNGNSNSIMKTSVEKKSTSRQLTVDSKEIELSSTMR